MKKSGCVVLVLFLAVCGSLFVNMALLAALMGRNSSGTSLTGPKVVRHTLYTEEVVADGSSTEKIAVIPLDGVIAHGQAGSLGEDMVQDFKDALQQALDDSSVKAAVISVDSPGGEITASDVLYNSLKEFSKHKKAVVYFNSIGASGAYYTACGGSYIMCNPTTFTGSIGVIISTLNYRDLFGKVGLQSVVFKSGKFKDMLNGAREMTPEESAYIQGLVMQSYGRFVGIVAKGRGLDEQALRNGVADGRILSGTDALAAKLVDKLGYIEDAYSKAREFANAPDAQVVRYRQTFSFKNLFQIFGESKAPTVQIDMLQGLPHLQPGRVYLLPPFFAP